MSNDSLARFDPPTRQTLWAGQAKTDCKACIGTLNGVKHLSATVRLRHPYPFVPFWLQLRFSPLKAGTALRNMLNRCIQLRVPKQARIDVKAIVQCET